MSDLDHTDADWADGAAVLSWVEERATLRPLTPATRRRWDRWRNGAQASFWDIDELMIGVGLHVSQLPANVWKPYDNGRLRRTTLRLTSAGDVTHKRAA